MRPGHTNAEPASIADMQRMEAAYRRAADGHQVHAGNPNWGPALQHEGEDEVPTVGQWARAHAPALLNLAGCMVFALWIGWQPLPLLGIGCFEAAAIITLSRAPK
jgi:hypothetical protein